MIDMALVRSAMFVPSDKENMLGKSLSSNADAVIFDLEDSVLPENKSMALKLACEYVSKAAMAGKPAIVRINALGSAYVEGEIDALVCAGVQAIMLPKADQGKVNILCELLGEAEKKYAVPQQKKAEIIPLVESALGIVHIYSLLGESPRVVAALLGAEDLTRELGVARTQGGKEIEYSRNRFAMACHAANIVAMDTPYTAIRDLAGLEQDTNVAKSFAFTAKACIHPSHAQIINQVFMPSALEVEWATGLLKAAQNEENCGKGAFLFEGNMIDAPVLERARKIINKTEAYSCKPI